MGGACGGRRAGLRRGCYDAFDHVNVRGEVEEAVAIAVALPSARGALRARGRCTHVMHGCTRLAIDIASLQCQDGARRVFTGQADIACAGHGGGEGVAMRFFRSQTPWSVPICFYL